LHDHLAPLIEELLGVSSAAASALAVRALRQQLPGNAVVYYQDDPTTHIFLLVRGHIRLSYISENGIVTLLSMATPGQSFGESGTLESLPHCDTAFTVGSTEIITLDCANLRDGSETAAELERAMARIFARRWRAHVDFTRALYLPNLNLRLSHALLRLLDDLGNKIKFKGQMVDCLGPVITQRDLGSMARGTRENVNKTLRGWENDGIIALEDRHILVLNREALEEISRAP
jgi:CRP/FNR family transcriptional regulator, cyclic AMP receptor protein